MKVPITMEGPERMSTPDYLFSVFVDVMAAVGAVASIAFLFGFVQVVSP